MKENKTDYNRQFAQANIDNKGRIHMVDNYIKNKSYIIQFVKGKRGNSFL